jgi:site-specific recombinase XerD
MRLADALGMFVEHMQADGRSVHTIGQYRRHIALLARSLETDDIAAISPIVLARFLNEPAVREGKKAATVNALRTSLRVFFAWCADADLVAKNPARLVRRARCGPPPPRALTVQETERLLAVVAADPTPEGGRDHAMFALMLATGIRLASAVALDVGDVDLERGEIRLRRVKGDRQERVFLGREIREHLSEFIGRRRSGPMFLSIRRERVGHRHVQRRLGAWLARAEVHSPATPHALRHSFAMRLYEKTRDIVLVQGALGHRSLLSTLVYARVDEDWLRRALG